MWDLRFSQQRVSVNCLLEWDVIDHIYQNMKVLPPTPKASVFKKIPVQKLF